MCYKYFQNGATLSFQAQGFLDHAASREHAPANEANRGAQEIGG